MAGLIRTDRCVTPPSSRFRKFWTTQPGVCGRRNACGDECSIPALSIIPVASCDDKMRGCHPQIGCETPNGRTIATNDWVRSLALNILFTDAEKDANECGYSPGNRGGYWADAYRTDGQKTGSRLRQLKVTGRVRDLVEIARVYAQADLQKMVKYGVALKVEVTARYIGGNEILITATIYGEKDTARVAVSGNRLSNAWVWNEK